jgi:hypothetical protein
MKSLLWIKIVGMAAGIIFVATVTVYVFNPNAFRTNPLLAQSNRVYHFMSDDYLLNTDDADSFNYTKCWRGGPDWTQGGEPGLAEACQQLAKNLTKAANKAGFFQGATLANWQDQDLLKKLYSEEVYFNAQFEKDVPPPVLLKYQTPGDIQHDAVAKQQQRLHQGLSSFE